MELRQRQQRLPVPRSVPLRDRREQRHDHPQEHAPGGDIDHLPGHHRRQRRRGAVATGIVNNYYWARLRTENGADKMHSQIHHFANGDVGALVNISGAAALKSSLHAAAAERFLLFLVSRPAQEALAKSDVSYEYPLATGVAANPLLKPFDALHPPELNAAQLGDDMGRFSWRQWTFPFAPARGAVNIMVRARNNAGQTQVDKLLFNGPGYHNNVVQKLSLTAA